MRHALGVEYDGSAFQGWQRLHAVFDPQRPSVQGALESALSRVAGHPVSTICAGRTDAGVHAQCQVVHFDSDASRSERAWVLGTASHLPPDISVRWCVPVAEDFSARFSAHARRYCYRILNRSVRPALDRRQLTWVPQTLDANAMQLAAQQLLGERDFSAFRSAQCEATHARRLMQRIEVRRLGDQIDVNVQANAFLHHMVRNIVGSLLLVGKGERSVDWIADVLEGRDRTRAGPTAPASGLIFVGPLYASQWNLPVEVSE